MSVCSPDALFFNTGKLGPNPDTTEEAIDQKFNEFVVYDESQVHMRYLVHFTYNTI